MSCKHEKDKYGCIEGCKVYYPVIGRESIIAEMDASEEISEQDKKEFAQEMECWQAQVHIAKCESCKALNTNTF